MNRKFKVFNKIVGIKDEAVYVLEEVFQYKDGLKGATGYSMRPLTQDEIDTGNDTENLRDLWKDAVAYDQTEQGLEDYANDLRNWCDGYFPSDDPSFRHGFHKILKELPEKHRLKIEQTFGILGKDYVDWTCDRCGRCFDADDKWDYVVDKRLVNTIIKFEKGE